MTRLEQLTMELADDLLTDAEARELENLVAGDNAARQAHIRILEIEAGLRGGRQDPELAGRIMARLRRETAD
jgi:hypothetical protein